MKTVKMMAAVLSLLTAICACDDFGSPAGHAAGELRWVLDRTAFTKASEALPDTNDFILTVRDAAGKTLFEGPYGESPEVLEVAEGYYTVGVVSLSFTAPAFDRPQYGDEQVVKVPSGGSVTVKLKCTLLNAGIRLKTGNDFLQAFPDGILYVKQGDVKLKYLYRETRIAYMKPGEVSVLLLQGNEYETLFTRTLEAREILTVSISAPQQNGSGKSSIQIQTDTTKVWNMENYTLGDDNGQGEQNDAISVGDAADHIGEEGIWVTGYIVGGDLTSSGKSVKTSGITKNTHLALAERSTVTTKASCVAVELPQGKVRDALNLVDHPDLIGRRVSVKGNLVEKYYGTIGLKGTGDFEIK
ncbi:MAG: DUF4493 domain-containing protein [Bacteroidales bacterium]|nr:DUF4493 domain-containing protein [Bacteroidales bacterium]